MFRDDASYEQGYEYGLRIYNSMISGDGTPEDMCDGQEMVRQLSSDADRWDSGDMYDGCMDGIRAAAER